MDGWIFSHRLVTLLMRRICVAIVILYFSSEPQRALDAQSPCSTQCMASNDLARL